MRRLSPEQLHRKQFLYILQSKERQVPDIMSLKDTKEAVTLDFKHTRPPQRILETFEISKPLNL